LTAPGFAPRETHRILAPSLVTKLPHRRPAGSSKRRGSGGDCQFMRRLNTERGIPKVRRGVDKADAFDRGSSNPH
jgi:hypothetical protein